MNKKSQEVLGWHKASASASSDCVEVAVDDQRIYVRDSKDPQGSVLTYTPVEWAAFIDGVKSGEFDIAIGSNPQKTKTTQS